MCAPWFVRPNSCESLWIPDRIKDVIFVGKINNKCMVNCYWVKFVLAQYEMCCSLLLFVQFRIRV